MVTIPETLSEIADFAALTAGALDQIAALAELRDLSSGSMLIEEGQIATGLYIVMSGEAELTKGAVSEAPIHLNTYHAGAFFALESIQTPPEPSPCQVRAGAEGVVVELVARGRLNELLAANPEIGERIQEAQDLKNVVESLSEAPSLAGLPKDAVYGLARETIHVTVPAGTRLIAEGDREDFLYVIKSGRLVVSLEAEPDVRVTELGTGNIIGEMAVLQGTERTATVTSEMEADLYRISGAVFRSVVDEHESLAKKVHELIERRQSELKEFGTSSVAISVPATRGDRHPLVGMLTPTRP